MLGLTWADGVAAVHLAAIVFMLTGGFLAWRWPRLLWRHAPLAAAILAINLARADCPLTVLELRLREAAGERPYSGGFIGHYLVEPVHSGGITPGVQLTLYLVALMPNIVAYGFLAARHRARARAQPSAGDGDYPTPTTTFL
jgi:Protein of Unknown function (DUF2784)